MASSKATSPVEDSLQNNSKKGEESQEAEWLLARQGINFIINNNQAEAKALFLKYPDSLLMFAGYSFTVFMDALMSFEEEKLTNAISVLKEVEKRCATQNGWLKSISHKVFGMQTSKTLSLAQQLETQIILADSQVCLAILTFLQHDLSGYFKGGWVFRKAWKVYEKTYKEILTLYKNRIGDLQLQLPDPLLAPLSPTSPFEENTDLDEAKISLDWDIPETELNGEAQKIDTQTIIRLMGAISFGHGLFQLGVSLLPPSLTRLVSMLGFEANRQSGIACLMYSRIGVDMRAPLASLALLWYHTIVRPFYAIDGVNVQAGVEAANMIIRESQDEFSDSSLFLFFSGRANRLSSNIPEALKSFQKANENTNQHEINMLCLHEIGWCHLIQLDYHNAQTTFLYLKWASKWSTSFYEYLAVICTGASQDFSNYAYFEALQKCCDNGKTRQLDIFLRRRLQCCPKDAESAKNYKPVYFKLMVFEMLYLWNAIASCTTEDINKIVTECENVNSTNDEPRVGLRELILGSCYSIRKSYAQSIDSYRKCLEKRRNELNNAEHAHISAFAQYELGNLLAQCEETREEGKSLLLQMSRYTNYDFEARLNVRVHSTLKNL